MVCVCSILHILDLASYIASAEQEKYLGNSCVARYSWSSCPWQFYGWHLLVSTSTFLFSVLLGWISDERFR